MIERISGKRKAWCTVMRALCIISRGEAEMIERISGKRKAWCTVMRALCIISLVIVTALTAFMLLYVLVRGLPEGTVHHFSCHRYCSYGIHASVCACKRTSACYSGASLHEAKYTAQLNWNTSRYTQHALYRHNNASCRASDRSRRSDIS